VQAVGELDEHHAHVLRHGQQHLAQALRLRVLVTRTLRLALEFLDYLHLRDAVHEFCDARTELLLQVLQTHAGVLDHVVENRGCQGFMIQPQVGEGPGHRQGMLHVRFAGYAPLTRVCPGGERYGTAQDFLFRLRPARQDGGEPVLQRARLGRFAGGNGSGPGHGRVISLQRSLNDGGRVE